MNEREMWLLNEVSSIGRATIDVRQYEELRALAKRLVAELEWEKKAAARDMRCAMNLLDNVER